MLIKGLQKLTLLDYPQKTACTIFTGGCNFRCPFCHNASLVIVSDNVTISEQELFAHLKKRKGVLDGVCITGGEPLLQIGIEKLIENIKKEGYLVKLDTNGYFPTKLKYLIDNKLVDYVAMDIKNCLDKYTITSGLHNIDTDKIIESIKIIMNSEIDYEFRTTAVSEFHTLDDFHQIGRLIQDAKRYFIQNFVDTGDLLMQNLHPMSQTDLIAAKSILLPYVEYVEIRGI